MKILILGAAGFIGTNLAIELARDSSNRLKLVDKNRLYFSPDVKAGNVEIVESSLDWNMDYSILENCDVVYHLVSTNVPTTSNQHISQDIEANVLFSSHLFEACVKYKVKKVVFISSGGTVYGKESACPLAEGTPTNPISSYGVQKITIEKLLYLYNYMYGLDYRIVRLANPYGPYQRPNGVLGAVTTFTYKALKGDEITVYGDGSVIRDFIYIGDAVRGILNIVNSDGSIEKHIIPAGYCSECNLYFIMESTYEKIRGIGTPLCRLTDEKNYLQSNVHLKGINLAKKTLLMQYGYNVSQQDGLSEKKRRTILASLIDNNILTKNDIISYLDFFINQKKSRLQYEKAIEKWKIDREFIFTYKRGTYTMYDIGGISNAKSLTKDRRTNKN